MDSLYSILLSPGGRVLLLSLVIGIATSGVKAFTHKDTFVRALLPAIPIFVGVLAGLIPGVLTGEAPLLLGAGAGALSSSTVELWNRYKAQLTIGDLKKLASGNAPPLVKKPASEEPEIKGGKP